MKVKDVMTLNVQSCRPGYSLAEAATLMWDYDCGALPVINESGEVLGLITDRDIAIAAAARGRPASEILVQDVISGNAFVCAQEEEVESALTTMKREKVHRLPVVGDGGTLTGILSMNDIILRAEEKGNHRQADISYEDVVGTLKAIGEHIQMKQSVAGFA